MKRRRRLNTFLFHLFVMKKKKKRKKSFFSFFPCHDSSTFSTEKIFHIFTPRHRHGNNNKKGRRPTVYKVKEASLLYCVVSDGRYHKRTRWSIPSRCDVPPFPFKKKNGKKKERNWENDDKFFFRFFCVVWYRHSLASKKKVQSSVLNSLSG